MVRQIKSIGADKLILQLSNESFVLCKSAARNELEHQDSCLIVGKIGIPVKMRVPKIGKN